MTTKIQSFERFLSTRLLLVIAVLMPFTSWAQQQFFTDVTLLGGSETETDNLKTTYREQGWTVLVKDLNAGAEGDYIFLAYKKNTVSNASSFITDFYIKSGSGAPDSFESDGRTYKLVPYVGGTNFVNSKGDLNRGAGGDYIHLYYTTESFPDRMTVTNIYFNNTQSGAVGKDGGSTGYDLNSGAGGDYIYMHVEMADLLGLEGEGIDGNPYLINNTNDWNLFVKRVEQGDNLGHYKLTANINVTNPVGTSESPFCGNFEGNGKTINVNINSSTAGAAPFQNISNASVRNLNVTGAVTSSENHASGLVGCCSGMNNIINCTSNATVSGSDCAGGLVGNGGDGGASLVLYNCVFGGSIQGFSTYAGGLVGWCGQIRLSIINCLCKGAFSTQSVGAKYHPIAIKNSNSDVTPNVTRAFYLYDIAPSEGLTRYFRPIAGAPVTPTIVPDQNDVEVVCADGQTYYAPSCYSNKYYRYYGFENGMAGWSTSWALNSTGIVSDESNTGGKCFRLIASDTQDQFLISPEIGPGNSLKRMNFFFKGTTDTDMGFQIGYSLTTNKVDDFTWSDGVNVRNSTWGLCTVSIPYPAKYVAFKDWKWASTTYIDDIIIDEPYPLPINVNVSNKTENSVTLSWEAPDPEVWFYQWEYRKTSTPNNWLGSSTGSGTSVTLTGLEAGTEYKFILYAYYTGEGGNAARSNGLSVTFSTLRPMVSLPHIQDFEEGMKGWDITNAANGTGITTDVSLGGTHSFVFEPGDDYQYLQSPLFEEDRTIDVLFYCKVKDSNHPASFVVAYSGTNGDNLETSDLVTIDRSGWGRAAFQLPTGTRFFFIVWISGDKLYIDDISFHDYDYETGIEPIADFDVDPVNFNGNTRIYNLSGQQLQRFQKGINIINGKKVLFK